LTGSLLDHVAVRTVTGNGQGGHASHPRLRPGVQEETYALRRLKTAREQESLAQRGGWWAGVWRGIRDHYDPVVRETELDEALGNEGTDRQEAADQPPCRAVTHSCGRHG